MVVRGRMPRRMVEVMARGGTAGGGRGRWRKLSVYVSRKNICVQNLFQLSLDLCTHIHQRGQI